MCVLCIQTVAVFASAFTMVAIGIDRYKVVIFPLKPHPTRRVTAFIIAVTWTLAMIASLPVAMYSRVTSNQTTGVPRDLCLEEWPNGSSQRYAYSIAVMVLHYFSPLAVLSFTYAKICAVMWIKKSPGEAENKRDHRAPASRRKVLSFCLQC